MIMICVIMCDGESAEDKFRHRNIKRIIFLNGGYPGV